jgi:lipid-A-disaccharide synthase
LAFSGLGTIPWTGVVTGLFFLWMLVPPKLESRRMSKRLYVVAGELSGDAHGAGLLRSLKTMVPAVEIHGAGGPEMAAVAGPNLRDWVEDAAVMGVWEVLKRYGWFKQRFTEMLDEVRAFRPDVLLLIDYPGYNLRFAEAVKRECPETRLVYYISPQVWAWHKGRIPKMARLLDEMLCLFPFEQPIFENAGLKTTFVGHPLVDELEQKRLHDAHRDESLVGLFPGSREREVARLFPMMIETAARLRAWRGDLKFEVPAASAKLAGQIRGLLAEAGADEWIALNTGGSHALMQRAGCAVIASGTATLEAAYYGLPYCLVYRVAPLTYVMAKLLVKIKLIGLVNILAGEDVVREFVQADAEPQAVSQELRALMESPEKRAALQARLAETTGKLGAHGAHERAAHAVAQWLLH